MAERRDPGLDNLEAFIAVLADTIGQVGAAQPHLEEHEQALETLHGEADQELRGFDAELDKGLADAGSLADEAKAELEKIDGTATEGTEGVLSEADSAFDDWTDKLGSTLDDAAETIGDASEDLGNDGFDDAVEALEDAVSAVQSSKGTTEAGFEALVAMLKHEGDRFTGSLVTASLAGEEAAQAASALESEFEGKANGVTEGITSASDAAAAVHAETGGQSGPFYDGIEGRAQSEAQELIDGVKGAFQQASEAMLEGAREPLEEPVDSLVNDALEPFAEEIGSWVDQNDAAEQGLSTWDQHLADLSATLVVVEQIDELNKALE
jgi:hypothetical protein